MHARYVCEVTTEARSPSRSSLRSSATRSKEPRAEPAEQRLQPSPPSVECVPSSRSSPPPLWPPHPAAALGPGPRQTRRRS